MRALAPLLAYLAVTALWFGGPLQPITLVVRTQGLAIPYWPVIAIGLVALSAWLAFKPGVNPIPSVARAPVFVLLAVSLPTLVLGLAADFLRHRAVLAFGADAVEEHSFFNSIREELGPFRFGLHTAALKECKGYAWSYDSIGLLRTARNVVPNVLPVRWTERCGIRLDNAGG